jgi:hypothetical protein
MLEPTYLCHHVVTREHLSLYTSLHTYIYHLVWYDMI